MKRVDWADLHGWSVEREASTPLFRQLYLQVRAAIAAQRVRPGTRLPSTRLLASRLGVARASVVAAYEELLAEGYVTGRTGSGTYVSEALPAPVGDGRRASRPHALREAPLPEHARVFESLLPQRGPAVPAPFATGRTTVDNRTLEAWRRISHRALRDFSPVHLGYTDPAGLPELRAVLCDYLQAARAVRCDPEQIVITNGTQQAIDLAIRVLLRRGDDVWLEDPCYLLTHGALVAAGMRVRPIPVDGEGIDVRAGRRLAPRARAAYVTPSHQYPLGVTLSMPRRLALLEWAQATGAWIIEDDYDSVFRFEGRPLASLQGLDESARVIYAGSLNKVLFPGLRMGYAVVPRALLPAYVNLRNLTDRHPASFNQTVLAQFMAEGHFAAHLRRTRLAYQAARDALTRALARGAGDVLTFSPPEQGMHGVAYLRAGHSDAALVAGAQREGLATRALSRTYLQAPPRQGLILGFSGYSPAALTRAAGRLAQVARQ